MERVLNLEIPPGNTHPAFFRKETNGVYEISNFVRNKEEGTVGIQNDLDGGPPLIWQFTQDNEYVYCLHQAINLIDGKDKGTFDLINPKLPAKKKELTEFYVCWGGPQAQPGILSLMYFGNNNTFNCFDDSVQTIGREGL